MSARVQGLLQRLVCAMLGHMFPTKPDNQVGDDAEGYICLRCRRVGMVVYAAKWKTPAVIIPIGAKRKQRNA